MAGSLVVFVEAIAKRERALQEAMQHAEAANRTKSQFLANMSHELRTPLNAILGFSEIIKDAYVGPIPTHYQTYGQDIHRSGQHLLAIINDVLDFSKIEAGRLELHDEEIIIAEVARACSVLVAALAHEKQVFIEFEVGDDACIVADELRLKQIVLNLLSNAVKFTHTGGFFIMVGLATILERKWKLWTGKAVTGVSGTLWATAWQLVWGSGMVDAWARRGMVANDFLRKELRFGKALIDILLTVVEWMKAL